MRYTKPFIYYPIQVLQYYTLYNTKVNVLPFVRYYYFTSSMSQILNFLINMLICEYYLLI